MPTLASALAMNPNILHEKNKTIQLETMQEAYNWRHQIKQYNTD